MFIQEAVEDLRELQRLAQSSMLGESMDGQDYDVFVGQRKLTTIRAHDTWQAIQLARGRLFQTNPGQLGEYDGLKLHWTASSIGKRQMKSCPNKL